MSDAAASPRTFDLLIRNGSIHDGGGGAPYVADVGVSGEAIVEIGALADARAATEIDATGMAVAPGFINMLSHSYISMLQDPRSMGELKQGVTLQIFGEGNSMGPLTPEMQSRMRKSLGEGDMPVEVPWRSLAEYLAHAEKTGVSQNIASYIGATTLRIYAVGQDDRQATASEMDVMRGLVRDEMSAGALGIGSSLIYPPAFFASTEELIELCRAAAPYNGKYISHMRDEGRALIPAVEELLRISREGGVPAEIYHLKQAGKDNWHKLDQVDRDGRAGARLWRADHAPTCTPTPPVRPGSRTRSRHGFTTADPRSSSSDSRTRPPERKSATRSSIRATAGRICTGRQAERKASSYWARARRRTVGARARRWRRSRRPRASIRSMR